MRRLARRRSPDRRRRLRPARPEAAIRALLLSLAAARAAPADRTAPQLHSDSRALIRAGFALAQWQEAGPLRADIDQRRVQRRQQTHYPPDKNAAGRRRVAALDIKLDGRTVFDPGGAPLAGAGAYQELAAQDQRYPRPASNCAVS